PARRSGHAVLPHPAHRLPSPAVFGWGPPGPVGPGWDDDAIEGDQAERAGRPVDLGEAPGPAAVMPLRDEQREPHQRVAPDLVERAGGVPVTEIARPAAQEEVD